MLNDFSSYVACVLLTADTNKKCKFVYIFFCFEQRQIQHANLLQVEMHICMCYTNSLSGYFACVLLVFLILIFTRTKTIRDMNYTKSSVYHGCTMLARGGKKNSSVLLR